MMFHVLPKTFRPARYFAPVAMLAFLPLATPFADDYFPPPDAKGGWRTLTDPAKIAKTAGLDRQKLDEAFDYVQNTSQHGVCWWGVTAALSTNDSSAAWTAGRCPWWLPL